MRMSEKCRNNKYNNNSDNPLTSRRTNGGKKEGWSIILHKVYNFCRIAEICGYFSTSDTHIKQSSNIRTNQDEPLQ